MALTQKSNQKVVLIFSETGQKPPSPIHQSSPLVRLTKTRVDALITPLKGQIFLRDTDINGFALRATPGSKSFILEKRIEGRSRRITLGRYPDFTVEQARREALKMLCQVATGNNPITERQTEKLQTTTLREAFDAFVTARKNLKQKTVYDYRRVMLTAFGDWLDRSILSITKDDIAKRHTRLGENSGPAYANLALRTLRALLNFCMAQYEDSQGEPLLKSNPVSRLTKTRAWYRISRRQTIIKTHELAAWLSAVLTLRSQGGTAATVADYLLLLLFTGLRRQEGAQLRWANIDLKGATLTIPDTKNHEPLELPLSDFLLRLLKERRATVNGPYVFPGTGDTGYLIEPRAQIIKVMMASGIKFSLHDLRRTFITIAESLDISAYAVKRLVNHKMRGDVTAGYIIADAERLRKPMQRITDYMLKMAEIKPIAEIIPLSQAVSG